MIRFSKKPLMIALGAAALTLSVSAMARPPFAPSSNGGGDVTIADVEAKQAERIAKIDTDGNGLISLAEFLAGKASRPHEAGFHGRPPSPGMGGPGMRGAMGADFDIDFETVEDSVFAELDSDNSSTLSRSEFTRDRVEVARGNAFRKAVFAELDTNNDGSLSSDEMPNPVERLRALDTDGDGTVTREERKTHWQNRGTGRPGQAGRPAGAGA